MTGTRGSVARTAGSDRAEPPIRAAELVGALSVATDLGTGQPLEHAVRSAVLAVRLGELAGASADELSDTYYVGPSTPAGITDQTRLVRLETPEACPLLPIGAKGAQELAVPASSSCELGITINVKPAPGQTTVGPFTIPLLIGPNENATPLTLTGTGTG